MFFVWIYGLFACFSTLLSVQRETTEVFEAEQPMSRFVHSSFQLMQLRFTLFIYVLDANNKGFIGLHSLIIQLIKSAIRTISRPPETMHPGLHCGETDHPGDIFSCVLVT